MKRATTFTLPEASTTVVDCTLPSQNAVMGAAAAIKASGGFKIADYVEIVDIDSVKNEAQKIAKAYAPPNS